MKTIRRIIPAALLALSILIPNPAHADEKFMEKYNNKDYVGALGEASTALKRDPKDTTAAAIKGWSLFQLGNYTESSHAFEKVRKLDPYNIHGAIGPLWIALNAGDIKSARKWLKAADKGRTQVFDSMYSVAAGWIEFFSGDMKKATKQFKQAKQDLFFDDAEYISMSKEILNGWEAAPRVGLGWIHFTEGDNEAAKAAFEDGIYYDKGCHLCYDGLAQIALAEGKRKEALKLVEKGMSVVRHDPNLITLLNKLLASEPNLDTSIAIYERVAKASNNDPTYLAQLGWALFWKGDYARADKVFDTSLKGWYRSYLARLGKARVACVKLRNDDWYQCMDEKGFPAR